MAYEQKPDSGSLFKNDRKERDTHADYRGSALVNGAEYFLDAWLNEARDGSKYMSLKFKRKLGERARGYSDPADIGEDLGDVPF